MLREGSVNGTAWFDNDGDNARETGERGVAGVPVALILPPSAESLTSTTVAKTRTSPRGEYRFGSVATGTYTVEAQLPGPDGQKVRTASRSVTIGATGFVEGIDFAVEPPPSILDTVGEAGVRQVQVSGPDGLELTLQASHGIYPWQVEVHRDPWATKGVAHLMASPAYQVTLPKGGGFTSAKLTLPYRPPRLSGFAESQLKAYYRDDETGLWMPAHQGQVIDTAANTITVETDHFSAWGVFMLRPDGFGGELSLDRTSAACQSTGAAGDHVLVQDASGSMSSSDPDLLRATAAKNFVDGLLDQASVGVVSFEDSATSHAPMTALRNGGRTTVAAAIDAATYAGGGTNIGAGVRAALDLLGEPEPHPQTIVLLSDGVGDYDTTLSTRARDSGVVIYTIGLGEGANESLLQQIATQTGGAYFPLASADQLQATYDALSTLNEDDGTDTDLDGLTDCEETRGIITQDSFYELLFSGSKQVGTIHRTTSDPTIADTDGDRLSDREEAGEKLLLSAATDPDGEYQAVRDAGIVKYYQGLADPRSVDSDADRVDDYSEVKGKEASNGTVYDANPKLRDSDQDLLDDPTEYEFGTDPMVPDPNELGVNGLKPGTLFQPDIYNPYVFDPEEGGDAENGPFYPLFPSAFQPDRSTGSLIQVRYHDALIYGDGYECIPGSDCPAIMGAAYDAYPADNCMTIFFGENCGSIEDKMKQYVEAKVSLQAVFNPDGSVRGDFTFNQAVAQCVLVDIDASSCGSMIQPTQARLDPIHGPDLESATAVAAAAALWSKPGGYRPTAKQLCGGADVIGGVYEIVEIATDKVRYVGSTNDFDRRRREHFQKSSGLFYQKEGDFELRVAHRTRDHEAKRGLEQYLFDQHWGNGAEDATIEEARQRDSLNKQRPMAFTRDVRPDRLQLARRYLLECL